ncbi:hypothetical protein CRENBAI_005339 [Crenichthys baileyi]|uniref:Uncharacterized protein n=1 Tax=Crenichthys baileyi TaxID=28760 RepID=A0AAV9QVU9_9TELE
MQCADQLSLCRKKRRVLLCPHWPTIDWQLSLTPPHPTAIPPHFTSCCLNNQISQALLLSGPTSFVHKACFLSKC